MQGTTLRTLEFDRVREALGREALTPLGRARVATLAPATAPDSVRASLALTAAASAFVAETGSLAISSPEDLDTILAVLAIDEQPLDPLALLGLARLTDSADDVATGIRRYGGDAALTAIAGRVASFDAEVAAIRRAIEPSGDVSDRASAALADIREKLRRQRAKLRSSLETLTRGRDTAKYLQDQIVTDRNGRYVVVVRAEHREAIPGIVHGSSASGASLYLEPLATVSLNNDVVELAEREKAEIHRILLSLTNAFRARGEELGQTLDAVAELDELHAKVGLAHKLNGIAPDVTDDGRIEFRGARHPLLRRDIAGEPDPEHPREDIVVIASDLVVEPPARALVISGPNTGGKTVALKAFGLLALMAQAGVLIPVDPGSRFTPFRSMFADIGDDQSIAASLSTFSARIANLVATDRALELPALILLDEVGSGTDPVEGGALGAAVIDHFRRRGAIVIATTHDDALKSYATTTDGVTTASFGFDPDTYAPTYRMRYGTPGRSLALEIAERLGMPAGVIADARARRTGRESLLAEHLARVDRELSIIARDRTLLDADRKALQQTRDELVAREARLTEREAVLRRRLDDKLNEKLRDARAEVDRIVGNLRKRAESLAEQAGQQTRASALSTGDVGHLRADARAALGAIGETMGEGAPADAPDTALTQPPAIGQSVFVRSFAAEGIVRGVSGKQIDVDVRGKRMRVRLDDLASRAPKSDARSDSSPGSRTARTSVPEPRAAAELVLVGAKVDEALDRAGKFLDDALMADQHRVRVVHGHGTGRLREALRAFFKEHPLVASVRAAADNEGGQAATIVELKE